MVKKAGNNCNRKRKKVAFPDDTFECLHVALTFLDDKFELRLHKALNSIVEDCSSSEIYGEEC